ncbi:sugar nucleotide-binding protein [Antarcticibacterium sp. 1MA-6-2]|uniref:sugar nucleotide-binding protein n=1 Tax=Antarcticibacterium sp. 1MA-6-2 TaxID=2908210 RepID=UPI001F340A59|nr:sugar nucleotide-binding protein [Antarcticibacterium sp. 1MA-6-2]UJH91787.1 sugar nucleotide-binding protein [Antarcticibacterium sp. 1MA-6-2]
MKKILILGASGFIGNALYKELCSYFDTYGTYFNNSSPYSNNKKFFEYDQETENIQILLENLRPTVIISAIRGNFETQVQTHLSIIDYILRNDCKLIFISSANVFDAFTNYPSYEYDKTLSQSIYGRFKIKIENALLRLPNDKYNIIRLPMVFGANSPRVVEIKNKIEFGEALEVFPNVVVNATDIMKVTQQIHYIINRKKQGVFHLGSNDLTHQHDLIVDIAETLGYKNPLLKQVYDSNYDRFLAVLPKDNLLPKNLQVFIQDVVKASVII